MSREEIVLWLITHGRNWVSWYWNNDDWDAEWYSRAERNQLLERRMDVGSYFRLTEKAIKQLEEAV